MIIKLKLLYFIVYNNQTLCLDNFKNKFVINISLWKFFENFRAERFSIFVLMIVLFKPKVAFS